MNFPLTLLPVVASAIILMGCSAAGGITSSQSGASARSDTTLQDELGPYNGPRPRIAVADFQWKAGNTDRGAMTGLEDMLTTTLVQSQRYRVLERSQLQAIQTEQALGASGEVDAATAAQQGNITGADILIIAAVTGWEPDTGGGSVGGGGGMFGEAGALIGGLAGSRNTSSMAMDIRLVDADTGEVIAANNVTAEANDVDLGAALGGITGGAFGGGTLGSYSNTPMEKVIRECIFESTLYIVNNTPSRYFEES